MARRYARDPQVDQSLRHSVRDGVAVSIQSGSGENYFNAFAVHLKATTGEIALLAALPPLVGSLAQLSSAWLGSRFGGRRDMILFGVRLQACTWPFFILLPLLFPDHAISLFLACVVAYYAAGALVSPHWSSLMGELVPERKRGRYFALRNRLASMTSFAALVVGGLVLNGCDDAGAAYLGFMLIFALAAGGRLLSIWHLARMHDPGQEAATPVEAEGSGLWLRLRRSPLVRFSLFFATMQLSVAIASPFFAVYMLRDLHFSYLQYMVNVAASVLFQFLTLGTWGRLGDRYGHRGVMAVTSFLIPFIPLLWLFSSHPSYLLVAQAFSGAAWAGFTLSAGNLLYELVPPQKRVRYMAYHNVLANAGTFAGALLGGALAMALPVEFSFGIYGFHLPNVIFGLFLVSGAARLLVAWRLLPGVQAAHASAPLPVGRLIRAGVLPYRDAVFDLMLRLRALAMFMHSRV
jgi:MFS family permease